MRIENSVPKAQFQDPEWFFKITEYLGHESVGVVLIQNNKRKPH